MLEKTLNIVIALAEQKNGNNDALLKKNNKLMIKVRKESSLVPTRASWERDSRNRSKYWNIERVAEAELAR